MIKSKKLPFLWRILTTTSWGSTRIVAHRSKEQLRIPVKKGLVHHGVELCKFEKIYGRRIKKEK